jgi:hypothetical protein
MRRREVDAVGITIVQQSDLLLQCVTANTVSVVRGENKAPSDFQSQLVTSATLKAPIAEFIVGRN